jgi:hypothetical protein
MGALEPWIAARWDVPGKPPAEKPDGDWILYPQPDLSN